MGLKGREKQGISMSCMLLSKIMVQVKIMTLLKLIIGKIGCMVEREKSNGHSEDHDTS